jgi:hypothetical protein
MEILYTTCAENWLPGDVLIISKHVGDNAIGIN